MSKSVEFYIQYNRFSAKTQENCGKKGRKSAPPKQRTEKCKPRMLRHIFHKPKQVQKGRCIFTNVKCT